MSEHRRKPPQPQGGGRAAARRGQSGPSYGRRAAPRGATGSPADYGLGHGASGEEQSFGSRAEARRAAQRSTGGRRRGPEPTGGRRGGPQGPGRGRGRSAPGRKRLIDYPRADKYGWQRWMPSWKLRRTTSKRPSFNAWSAIFIFAFEWWWLQLCGSPMAWR